MSDLSKYSGGPNPFIVASNLLDKFTSKKPEVLHSEMLSKHLEYANQVHEHAVGLINAHYNAASGYMKDVNKAAQPGTEVHVEAGAFKSKHTKKTPVSRTPTAPAKTAKPLPVRDPKTGRAMKAPQ